jgi:hypothetical protein
MASLFGSLMVFFVWEHRINHCLHLVEPLPSLSFCAGNNNTECSAVEDMDAAETENAILLDRFKRVSKNAPFSFRFSVRCVENDGGLGSE